MDQCDHHHSLGASSWHRMLKTAFEHAVTMVPYQVHSSVSVSAPSLHAQPDWNSVQRGYKARMLAVSTPSSSNLPAVSAS